MSLHASKLGSKDSTASQCKQYHTLAGSRTVPHRTPMSSSLDSHKAPLTRSWPQASIGFFGALIALASCHQAPIPVAPPEPLPPIQPAAPPVPTPERGEGRALWVSRFEYDSPGKIAHIMAKAASANFNVVYFQVRGAADALYVSALEPCGTALCGRLGGAPTWDPLEVAVREAHSRGLQLHAWLNALSGWGAGSAAACARLTNSDPGQPRHILLDHPEWAVTDEQHRLQSCPNADEYVWLSPGNPGVRTRLAQVAADIVRRYEVDGIHLDRIRYPSSRWSYDDASLLAFGLDPAASSPAWAGFRRQLINFTVKETFDSLRAANPSATLSAAVWGIYEDRWGWKSSNGYGQYFQDPVAWAAGRYLDVAVPMTYYTIAPTYCAFADWACLLDDHLARIQGAGSQLYIGINANKGAAEVERQILLARQRGASGVAIYSYSAAESSGLWQVLARGVFAERVAVRESAGQGREGAR